MTLPSKKVRKYARNVSASSDVFVYDDMHIRGDEKSDYIVVRIGEVPELRLYVQTEEARLALIKALGGKDDPVVSEGV